MRLTRAVLIEQINVAIGSIRGQALRTTLTVGIIGMGIMALIAMVTATESLKENIRIEFSSLGTDSFTITPKRNSGFFRGKRPEPTTPISYREAKRFAKLAHSNLNISASVFASGSSIIGRNSKRTDPNIQILGVDGNYIDVANIPLSKGRGFTTSEVDEGTPLIIIGSNIKEKLYDPWEEVLGSSLLLSGSRYTVIGVLESRGASFGMSQDNQCLISTSAVRRQFSDVNRSYTITCAVTDTENIEQSTDFATGTFRMIRGDNPGAPSSFDLTKSNSLVETLLEATSGITIAASVIGIITLFGAGIGLMNIMLVSVSERTREIGTRKSIGASARAIRTQFLVEVIIIGQLGGFVGIMAGLGLGNIIASYFNTPFVIPWGWIAIGIVLCTITSLVSGYYPATKAAKLDPITALGRV
jgi:putative ABC transport system permease protein